MRSEIYATVTQLNMAKPSYSISGLCHTAKISRGSYYKHIKRISSGTLSVSIAEDTKLKDDIINRYNKVNGIYGYRRITADINKSKDRHYNRKRIYRLMKEMGIRSVIRKKGIVYIKSTPEITAQNILSRNFKAGHPDLKWLTDITEFKIHNGRKVYLSAILDLCDKRIVSHVMSHLNNNRLVLDTFDQATASYPDAHPLVHSDRGYQYTGRQFKRKLDSMNAVQSMSRKGCCIDNGPMEGFWGIIKTEMYYLNTFSSYKELKQAVDEYIVFYNTERRQEKLNFLAPMEFRRQVLKV